MTEETKKWLIDQLWFSAILLGGMTVGWAVTVAGLWMLGVL